MGQGSGLEEACFDSSIAFQTWAFEHIAAIEVLDTVTGKMEVFYCCWHYLLFSIFSSKYIDQFYTLA